MPNKIEKTPDGKLHIEYETGEVFDGDPLEVTAKMAEAHVNTKHWGQEWKQKYETAQTPPPPQPPPQPVNQQEEETRKWVANQAAQGMLGMSPEDIQRKWQEMEQFKQQTQTNWAITQFYNLHPEYPGNEEANDKIGKIMDENGWPVTTANLEAAHLVAMNRKMYQAIDPKVQTPQNRTAPPILQTGNPEMQMGNDNPYAMDMKALRDMAIRQQLGGQK